MVLIRGTFCSNLAVFWPTLQEVLGHQTFFRNDRWHVLAVAGNGSMVSAAD